MSLSSTKTHKNTSISFCKKTENIKKNTKKSTIFASFFVIFVIFLMIFFPKLCIESIFDGLSVWAKSIVPSLLPFMFFTKLLTSFDVISGLANKLGGITNKLFKAPKISSYIFFMSIISGYPVGAKLISEYKKLGIITSKEANKLSTFCSTSGPLFIVGSVGTSMLFSAKIGYIILISHIVSSIVNGIIFRNMFVEKTNVSAFENKNISQNVLAESMKDSILSTLVVGGFVAIAFLVINLFENANIFLPLVKLFESFGIDRNISKSFLNGFLEVSKGCLAVSKTSLSLCIKGSIASFFVGFGGVCVFLQATAFLKDAGVNLKFYFAQKISHGVISAILTFVLCLIFKV